MAITPLSEATIHLLGSTQVLTTATSLIKELVDNALDAKATSIDILISQNTLDKIEVRDNGHGIPAEDIDSLGRRGHTSKIRSFEEVRAIGGTSLGFRGEALSSALQIAEVTVTTKTDGELIATCVRLKAAGGVDKQSRTSHPVGTTISVTRFMDKLPVRKQTALKEATKTLLKIKELLQAYALARPNIRFALKVEKSSKGSWSFSPRPKDGLREAVSLLFGRDLASQCIETVMEFPRVSSIDDTADLKKGEEPRPRNLANSHFVIEAFLPKSAADAAKISQGQYVSVDSRPVSCEKGTFRKIVVMFKVHLRSALSDHQESVKNPFLRLNIKCPLETYDLNVEPGKDDIIFANEFLVLESMEKLFKSIYGELKKEADHYLPRRVANTPGNFELLLARKCVASTPNIPLKAQGTRTAIVSKLSRTPSTPSLSARNVPSLPSDSALDLSASRTSEMLLDSDNSSMPPAGVTDSELDPSLAAEVPEEGSIRGFRRRWDFDMSLGYVESVEDPQLLAKTEKTPAAEGDQATETQVCNGHRDSLNPWLIAKLAAPVSARRDTSIVAPPSNNVTPTVRTRITLLPTPLASSDPVSAEPESYPDRASRRAADHAARELNTPESLPRRTNDFVLARDLIAPASVDTPPSIQHESVRRLNGPNRPFISPVRRNAADSPRDHLVQTTLRGHDQARTAHARVGFRQFSEPDPELVWAMDFEQRKEDATRQRRAEIRAARAAKGSSTQPTEPRVSPHKNRYNAAIAALDSAQPTSRSDELAQEAKEPFKTTLPDGDPRAYLMRRQKSMGLQAGKLDGKVKPMRAKSARLPLEVIPTGSLLHNVALIVQADFSSFKGEMTTLSPHDGYISRGVLTAGLPVDPTGEEVVSKSLQEVVRRWMPAEADFEVEYMWENLVNA